MKTIALCIAAVSLVVGGSALAGTRPSAPPLSIDNNAAHIPDGPIIAPLHACMTVAAMKTQIKGAKFTPLNIAQFHLMLGAYAATPPIGLPADTDNALLIQLNKKSMVVWMKAECASKTPPMPIGDQFVAILRTIKPVAGETSDDSKDLHL